MKHNKKSRRPEKRPSRPKADFEFEYSGMPVRTVIDSDLQISFFQDGKPVEDPEEQNRLMEYLISINRLPS